MIIREEYIFNDGRKGIKTYSDRNKYILQNETGKLYESAIDVADSSYTYTELDIDIPQIPDLE